MTMNKFVGVVAAAGIAFGLAFSANAGPTPEQQTSPEQVKMCRDVITACQGGDRGACVVAVKTCVGEDRQTAMKAINEG
jgi:hypothetical protein